MTTGAQAQAPGSSAAMPSEQGQYGAANPSTYGPSNPGSAGDTSTMGSQSSTPSPSAEPQSGQTGQGTWGASRSTGTGSAGTVTGTTDTASTLTDDQIAAVTNAANTGEVDQAKEVLKKTKNAKVRTFANRMVADHSAALKQQTDLE